MPDAGHVGVEIRFRARAGESDLREVARDVRPEVIAIDALVRLGRRPEAETRAARFAKAYPGSSHKTRIDALLGSPEKP